MPSDLKKVMDERQGENFSLHSKNRVRRTGKAFTKALEPSPRGQGG
jgi:hypothetical protein